MQDKTGHLHTSLMAVKDITQCQQADDDEHAHLSQTDCRAWRRLAATPAFGINSLADNAQDANLSIPGFAAHAPVCTETAFSGSTLCRMIDQL